MQRGRTRRSQTVNVVEAIQRIRAVDGCFVAIAVVVVGVEGVEAGAKLRRQLIVIAVAVLRDLRVILKLINVRNRIVVIDLGVQNLIKRVAVNERSQICQRGRCESGLSRDGLSDWVITNGQARSAVLTTHPTISYGPQA